MSRIDGKSPSDNDDNYKKEEQEEISKNFPPGVSSKKRKKEKTNFKKRTMKLKPGRLTISLRNRKSFRGSKSKIPNMDSNRKKVKKVKQKFLFPLKKKISEEKVEAPKLGKRCYLGGKAKGKPPPVKETEEKQESDDDSDGAYFSRISLGQYQQLNDKSGASTSYEYEEEKLQSLNPFRTECQEEYSEEDELKELEMWGRNILENYFCVVRNWRNYRELFRNASK